MSMKIIKKSKKTNNNCSNNSTNTNTPAASLTDDNDKFDWKNDFIDSNSKQKNRENRSNSFSIIEFNSDSKKKHSFEIELLQKKK